GSHACADNVINGNVFVLKYFENANMSSTTGSTAAQGQHNFRAGFFALARNAHGSSVVAPCRCRPQAANRDKAGQQQSKMTISKHGLWFGAQQTANRAI